MTVTSASASASVEAKTSSAGGTSPPVDAKFEAKAFLKRLLLQHNGEASHPEVQAALDKLCSIASSQRGDDVKDCWEPAYEMNFNTGNWRAITTPPFPGKLSDDDEDGKSSFTLGRMTFNMFKPTKAVCTVDQIVNVVAPIKDNEQEVVKVVDDDVKWKQTYVLEVLMDIAVPSSESNEDSSTTIKLPAELINLGVCFPQSPTRLGVKFTGGVLQPNFDMTTTDNKQLAEAWKKTFDGAIAKERNSQSLLGKVATTATHALMKWMMGLEPPTDRDDFTQAYKITNPYAGYLDILYMDEDMRVSRGNRGTIVVVERVP